MSKKLSFIVLLWVVFLSLTACKHDHMLAVKDHLISANPGFELPVDSLSSQRILFALQLRDKVAENWPGFNQKRVEGPFIYFNGEASEVFFSTPEMVANLEQRNFVEDTHSHDYLLAKRTDSIPYHFELMVSLDPADSSEFYYQQPVQQFLSVEETQQYLPSVNSTELWTAMVIHEMFHHFQYNNPAFMKYVKQEVIQWPSDVSDLKALCDDAPEFLSAVQQENARLLSAIKENSKEGRDALIREYLSLRAARIATFGKTREYLERVENYYVIQEGSARYAEYLAIKGLESFALQAEEPSLTADPMFKSFQQFLPVDLSADEFNYLTYAGPTTYHYALGFNTMRLLDQLGVEYKSNLLDHPEKPLHNYLTDYLNERTSN